MLDVRHFTLEITLSPATDATLIAYLDHEGHMNEMVVELLKLGYVARQQAQVEFLRLVMTLSDD